MYLCIMHMFMRRGILIVCITNMVLGDVHDFKNYSAISCIQVDGMCTDMNTHTQKKKEEEEGNIR